MFAAVSPPLPPPLPPSASTAVVAAIVSPGQAPNVPTEEEEISEVCSIVGAAIMALVGDELAATAAACKDAGQ